MRLTAHIHSEGAQAAFRRAPEVIIKHASQGLQRAAHELAREARQLAPKAFSTLTNSIGLNLIGDLHVRVSAEAGYGLPVETGRAPGRMPGAGLTDWVKQKTGLQGKALDRATFAIARSISRRGIPPQPFMAPAAERMQDRAVELVRESVLRGIAEVNA